jgi:hypothetical protein
MKILALLAETPIGRAILAYFADLPRWTLANIAFAIALAPALLAVYLDDLLLAALLAFPALFALAGQCHAFALAAEGRVPRWRHLLPASLPLTLALWAALALPFILLLLNPPPILFGLLCALLVVALLVAPFALCLPAAMPARLRGAFVLAVHFPIVALGLLVLVALFAALAAATRGALLVALPALWSAIAAFSTHQLLHDAA